MAIFHRGTHEIPEIPATVEHIHGDPHFRETFNAALAGRTFDVVIATYGRIRVLAEALAGKVGQFIAIGGVPVYRGYFTPSVNFPVAYQRRYPRRLRLLQTEEEHRFSYLIASRSRRC